ncbi:MAG: hypothetical protein PHC89_02750 [Candidatus Pacebacteria bacterium]|nr:hypothetical protein [Candidatus Paceibacterota bacterium]
MQREIIPAIMPEYFEDISELVFLVRNKVKSVQLDIMDGKYVPEKTWPFPDSGHFLSKIRSEEEFFPFWEEIDYELDLMIARPEEQLDTWLYLGASRIIFHFASVHDWEKIKTIDEGFRNFISLGIAVTIHDDLDAVFELIDGGHCDFVQVMGIAHIGYQGEPFEELSLGVIKKIRERYPDLIISVDGGVSLESIPSLLDAGIDRFVSGSGVFGEGSVEENLVELEALISGE